MLGRTLQTSVTGSRLRRSEKVAWPVLDGIRILDLCHEMGMVAGQILADLGADVIQVEPPEGSSARYAGSALTDSAIPLSTHWLAYSRNKRGWRADLAALAADHESSGHGTSATSATSNTSELARLLQETDVLLESFGPGGLEALGLSPQLLHSLNPDLIVVRISGFGQSGPKAHYRYTDLTALAASGYLYLTGEAARGPLRIFPAQGHALAGADAAVAVMVALAGRQVTGTQYETIDVSVQQSAVLSLLNRGLDTPLRQEPAVRQAGGMELGSYRIRSMFAARDGWVLCMPGILPTLAPFMQRLMQWAHEEGLIDDSVLDEHWPTCMPRMLSDAFGQARWLQIQDAMETLMARHTKLELMDIALQRRLLLAPCFSAQEISQSSHLESRQALWKLPFALPGATDELIFPGPFARFTLSGSSSSAAAQDENRQSAAVDAGLTMRSRYGPIVELPQETFPGWDSGDATAHPSARGALSSPSAALPFSGLKVLDVFWVVAGPGATRTLSDYGATVVHIESSVRQDTLRNVPPYVDGIVDPVRSGAYVSTNAGKHNLALAIDTEPGRALLEDLIRWADVVTESFAPGVAKKFGLDPESVHRINPRAVVMSSALMGQEGPWHGYAGFGNTAAAVTGFQTRAAEPDRPPAGPSGPYTDFIAVRYNAAALMAALRARAADPDLQNLYVDTAQSECALHFLTPAVLEQQLGLPSSEAIGNRDPAMAPHGVFACAGEDQWIALAVDSDAAWQALCRTMQKPDLAADGGLATLTGRKAREDEIESVLSDWCAQHARDALERELQQAGVAAHAVLNTADLVDDTQLAHRQFLFSVQHPEYGAMPVEAVRWHMAQQQPLQSSDAVTFVSGRDQVLGEILGLSESRVNELAEQGILR